MSFKPLFGQQKIFYGADYNPEQWLDSPEILEKDLELMKQAHCSIMSVGIFSWAKLEPQEGVYNFEWLDKVLDKSLGKSSKSTAWWSSQSLLIISCIP